MDPLGPDPLIRSFQRNLYAENRSVRTVTTYLIAVQQAAKVLKILYGWLAEEAEIPANPMAKIKKPIVPEQAVPIVPEEALKRLFRVCAGNTFEGRRDTALLMLLLDTGARRAETGVLDRLGGGVLADSGQRSWTGHTSGGGGCSRRLGGLRPRLRWPA